MKIGKLIELIGLNTEYDAYEGYYTKESFMTWLAQDNDYYISVPTGIEDHFLQIHIMKIGKN